MLNKKGFALTEVLVVTVFLVTIFTFVYVSIIPLIGKYEDDIERVKDIDVVYKLYHIRKMIKSDGNNSGLTSSFKEIKCTDLADSTYCNNLMNQLELSDYKLYYVDVLNDTNINSINNANQELGEYVKKITEKDTSYVVLLDKATHTMSHLKYNKNILPCSISLSDSLVRIYSSNVPGMNVSPKAKTVTITTNCPDSISYTRSSPNHAKVTLSGTTLTISGNSKGTDSITVKVGDGVNYEEAEAVLTVQSAWCCWQGPGSSCTGTQGYPSSPSLNREICRSDHIYRFSCSGFGNGYKVSGCSDNYVN